MDNRTIICSYNSHDLSFAIIFIYAPEIPEEKDSFWAYLLRKIFELSIPIILVGDMNEIENDMVKQGGLAPTTTRYQRILQIKTHA